MDAMSIPVESLRYELRFCSLFNAGRAFTFPCNTAGQVDCDGLTEAARRSYRSVCASVGREVALPQVRLRSADRGR
jgi:hypothetical protein